MRTNILRSVALMLCACLSSVAQAQYGGYSASAYNNYGASAVPVHPSLQANNGAGYGQPQQYSYQPAYQYQTVAQHMPAPDAGAHQVPAMVHPVQPPIGVQSHGQVYNQPQAQVHSQPAGQVYSQPVQEHHAIAPASAGCSTCNQTAQPTYTYSQPNVYVQAAAAPTCGGSCGTTYESYGSCGMPACGVSCAPEPTQIKRWFGGANILFLTRDDNYDRPLVFDDANPATTRLTAASAGQDFALGYDVTVGSYLGCGQYAISATWLHIDNGSDEVTSAAPTAGDYRANFRNWDRIYYDLNNNFTHDNYNVANDESIYAYFDRAESFTVRRNSSYYGLELNLTGFGIGGAARAGRPSCGGGQACGGGSCGQACGGSCGGSCGGCNTCCGPPPKGCGGQCGPMIPSCCCKLQMNWTTGFRWFHFEDSFGFSARSERAPAAPVFIDTFSYDVDAENELFGWQFGGQLSYCVGCRTSLYAGVKAGIYANDASLRSRISASNGAVLISDLAHSYPTYANQQVSSSVSDTVLASLAEIDLGIGYRICKCWTVRGGYRLISASGVATAIDNISEDPANLGASNVWADSNLILHGGYVGLNYNW